MRRARIFEMTVQQIATVVWRVYQRRCLTWQSCAGEVSSVSSVVGRSQSFEFHFPSFRGFRFDLPRFSYVYQLHTNVLRALFSAMPDFMGRVGHSSTAAVDETMRINWLVLFRDE